VVALSAASVLTTTVIVKVTVRAALLPLKIEIEEVLHPVEDQIVKVFCNDSNQVGMQPIVKPLTLPVFPSFQGYSYKSCTVLLMFDRQRIMFLENSVLHPTYSSDDSSPTQISSTVVAQYL
jgi:hypothetical protein